MSVSPPPAWPDERLHTGAARLAARHQGHFSAETVQQLLPDSYRLLADSARGPHPPGGTGRAPHR
ncbi:hypothetical protein [Streptomyces sp. NBC_01198]|uniref:hypothetical protein n=1 Tax=Streptomyces sp. NBC_01198 TaxID=2903769 RepID=UPI002E14EF45